MYIKFYFHLLVMSTLGPLLPSTSVGYDAGYSWQSRTVAESSFYNVFHSPGRVFRNGDVFHGARLGGFSFFASLSRYALTCICKMFGVPDLLISETMEHLISFVSCWFVLILVLL